MIKRNGLCDISYELWGRHDELWDCVQECEGSWDTFIAFSQQPNLIKQEALMTECVITQKLIEML